MGACLVGIVPIAAMGARTPAKGLAVLDALHGKSVVLLSAPPGVTPKPGFVAAYGTMLIVSK